jgi:hypothetical protein
MSASVCMVVIFNHAYPANIATLRRLYGNRFSRIVFLLPSRRMPDAACFTGYRDSYAFHGLVADAHDFLFRPAFPLLYLPASCSGRTTDIWRSFVAQRIGWERGWHLLIDEPTTRQERNVHDPMQDLLAEMACYWRGWELARRLAELTLPKGSIGDDMLRCYELLVAMRLVDAEELARLETWLAELA